jgi:hypothetical protein
VKQSGPVIPVGHSYAGAVITEPGNDPKVAGLVYIMAFAPDRNESVQTLIQNPAPARPCRRSSLRKMDFSCWTTRSSRPRSQAT